MPSDDIPDPPPDGGHASAFDFGESIIVRDTPRARSDGIAAARGTVVGRSYEDDLPGGRVLAYAVMLETDEGRTRMLEPGEIEAAPPPFARPS